jgi:hypothetical protein
MSRLTDSNKEIPLLINERYWLDIYFKLKEYENLEEQGLLLKLPCKVGDTVYVIDKRYTKCSLYDEEYSESSCWNCDKECDSKMYYVVVKRYVGTLEWIVSRLKKFGKTVFLTKEEAEQELKRLESAKCKE